MNDSQKEIKEADAQYTRRDLQLCELEILKDVVNICNKHSLRYWISSGTLLGAIRHGGFIPWDDDVDIAMPVKDCRRFLKIAQTELGKKYFVQSYLTDPNFSGSYIKVRKEGTTYMDTYHTRYHIHHGVWIDIFPLISVSDGLSFKIKSSLLKISNSLQLWDSIQAHKKEFQNKLGIVGMMMMKLLSLIPMRGRQALHTLLLKAVSIDSGDRYTEIWGNITKTLPKTVFDGEPVPVDFEDTTFLAPPEYIKYLEIMYGDWRTPPPEDKRYGHGKTMILDLKHSYEMYME